MAAILDAASLNDIPTLALKAALEVAAIKPTGSSKYAQRLREVLLDQTAGSSSGGSVRNLAPSTVEAYRQAAKAATQSAPEDFEELSAVLKRMAGDLEVFQEPDVERTARLLRFLTTVHDELLGERQASDLRKRPSNPRRV